MTCGIYTHLLGVAEMSAVHTAMNLADESALHIGILKLTMILCQ